MSFPELQQGRHSPSSHTKNDKERLMKGVFFGSSPEGVSRAWFPHQQRILSEHIQLPPSVISPEEMADHAEWLADTEVIFSTWGMPALSDEQLNLLPKLKAVFYAAGTVKGFADPLFDRGITVVSAWAANAIPTAEFTLAQILLSLKYGWRHIAALGKLPRPDWWQLPRGGGAFRETIGIIGLGMVGRKLCELLRPFDLAKIIYDPYVSHEVAASYGARKVGLCELFETSRIVTLNAPLLPETTGMITGALIASMKPDATFINTARGALVREEEMIAVLRERPDLTAVLDVTFPEPPAPDSPLYDLENVVLTPHIAGATGNEVERMSDLMISEFIAWKNGEPLKYAVTREMSARIS